MTLSISQWCLTRGVRVDERCDLDHRGHDHEHYAHPTGKPDEPLYRMEPIGTTYLRPDGMTLRLTHYYADDDSGDPATVIPEYDLWTKSGAATAISGHGTAAIWDGVALAPGVRRIVPIAPLGARVPLGAVYLRPDGEVWRLRDYLPQFLRDEGIGHEVSYAIQRVGGSMSTGQHLPDDATLVWLP